MLYRFDGRTPKVGSDTYVSPSALVIGDVTIGDRCYIGHGVILRGDYGAIEIGTGTAVEEAVVIHAPPGRTCGIGRSVTIGHGATVHAALVGDRSVIGMGAVLSLYAEVGEGAIVAEGAVVKMRGKIPPAVVAAGNPARVVRPVSAEDEEYWGMAKQLYVDLAKKYLDVGMEEV